VGEHWVHQRSLHAGITTERIDLLIHRALGAGALGAKPLGASGGGCVLVIVPEQRMPEVRAAVAGLGEEQTFRLAREGAQVIRAQDA
jgi:D-glycero-alpha-D-manno-heptose-7-phosphate kinase